jgi:hypothetical protein
LSKVGCNTRRKREREKEEIRNPSFAEAIYCDEQNVRSFFKRCRCIVLTHNCFLILSTFTTKSDNFISIVAKINCELNKRKGRIKNKMCPTQN